MRACDALPCAGATRAMLCSGTCFSQCADTVFHPTAETRCVAWGGHLATVLSAADQSCIELLMTGSGWMGYVQSPAAASPLTGWSWISGATPSGYVHWSPTEPNDIDDTENGAEQCGAFYPTGGWNDAPCTNGNAYVCSR